MSDLGKVIGGVLSGLADARANADKMARQLAIEYEADELLRLFPVPRIEFQTVDALVPIAVQDVVLEPQQVAPGLGIEPSKVEAMAARLVDILYTQLHLSRSERSKSGLMYKELVATFVKHLNELASQVTPPAALLPTTLTRIDVGVSSPELEKVVPAALGHIKLSVGVQNYEWVEVETRDGPVRKLVPAGR